jgi:hypothetical protein
MEFEVVSLLCAAHDTFSGRTNNFYAKIVKLEALI